MTSRSSPRAKFGRIPFIPEEEHPSSPQRLLGSPTNNGDCLDTPTTRHLEYEDSIVTIRRSPRSPDRHGAHHHTPRHAVLLCCTIFLSVALLLTANDNYRLRLYLQYHEKNYSKNLLSTESNDDLAHITPSYSIMPKKIYSVIGLESSGTQFVSKIIEDALQTGPYREGSRPCRETCTDESLYCTAMQKVAEAHPCRENADVQVQHFSLPWGGTCHEHPNPPILDVVLPQQCSRAQEDPIEIEQCNAMAQELWGITLNGQPVKYPVRYQLDITAQKKWYDSHGAQQIFIIVIRDDMISYSARHNHCNIPENRKQEEEVGTDLIVNAINTYILKDGAKVTKKTFQHWIAEQYQHSNNGTRTIDSSKGGRMLSALPSGNNVVVVSYESLVKLGSTYVKMLYNTLGIESDFIPEIRDSNEKYLNSTLT